MALLDKPQWAELYDEVVTSGLCTGCAACVVVCPYNVLRYDAAEGRYRPFHVESDGGEADCTHGQHGCTLCTRACPRFRDWEAEADTHLFGRTRRDDEPFGVYLELTLYRASDPEVLAVGQDGGLASAILIYALENDLVDAALVSYLEGDGTTWKAVPGLARSRAEVLSAAGSRYTYSANVLGYLMAAQSGIERLALVGMGCQASAPAILQSRRAGKVARRFNLTVGLLCSKTFDDAIFPELFGARYGLARDQIAKINIKGVVQLWMRDGTYHEVPLAEAHAFTRDGCKLCPDFAAEHADISIGGIGTFGDYTLTLVRTARGAEVIGAMRDAGLVDRRPIEDDPVAVTLLRRLSRVSRRRWPESAPEGPRRL